MELRVLRRRSRFVLISSRLHLRDGACRRTERQGRRYGGGHGRRRAGSTGCLANGAWRSVGRRCCSYLPMRTPPCCLRLECRAAKCCSFGCVLHIGLPVARLSGPIAAPAPGVTIISAVQDHASCSRQFCDLFWIGPLRVNWTICQTSGSVRRRYGCSMISRTSRQGHRRSAQA